MIDVQAREISEKDLEAGLRLAHPEVSHETCRKVPLYICVCVCVCINCYLDA